MTEVTISVQVGHLPAHTETVPFPMDRGFHYAAHGSSVYIARFGEDHALQADILLYTTKITFVIGGTSRFVLVLMQGSKAMVQVFSTPEETVPILES